MECSRCKKKEVYTKRCTGCYMVSYCSKTCQRTDWPEHKTVCKSSFSKDNLIHKVFDNTTKIENDKTTSLEETTECITEDVDFLDTHFKEDSQSRDENSPGSKNCNLCRKKAVKKCSRCKIVFYCSKECQKADWASHKRSCTRLMEQHEEIESPLINPFFNSLFSPFSPYGQSLNLSTVASTTDELYCRAIEIAHTRFPFQDVIYLLEDVPTENFFFRPQSNVVLVAFVPRYHHYRARHCIYIQDKEGEEIYVAFYLDFDNPFPYFSWASARPGRFIAIDDPCIHYFMDGSVGLRIEDPTGVHFLDV